MAPCKLAKPSIGTVSILILAASFLLAQAKESVTSFDFPSFNTSNLNDTVLKQDAVVYNNRIDLTKNRAVDSNFNGSLGWAVYKYPIRLWNKQSPRFSSFQSLFQSRKKRPRLLGSFQSHFQFSIEGAAEGAKNGLAFFLAPFGSEPAQVNKSSTMWLGIFNTSTNGTAPYHAVAIEFDSNRVGIDVNNISSVANYSLPKNQSLNNGNITWDAWIEYNATGMAFSVFLANVSSKPVDPILHVEDINLSQIFPRDVVVGFSASTIRGFDHSQRVQVEMSVISWKFSSQTPRSPKNSVAVIIVTMMLSSIALSCTCTYCTYTFRLPCCPDIPCTGQGQVQMDLGF